MNKCCRFHLPPVKLRDGNVFSRVCQSVCSGGFISWGMGFMGQFGPTRPPPPHTHKSALGPLDMFLLFTWTFSYRRPHPGHVQTRRLDICRQVGSWNYLKGLLVIFYCPQTETLISLILLSRPLLGQRVEQRVATF